MIESYGFGRMVVDGTNYSSDLIVYPDKISSNWWRKEGHSLAVEDLGEVIAYGPEIVVVGTGYTGMMKVPEATRESLAGNGIELVVEKTGRAYQSFNDLSKTKKAVGAFHLTC